VYTWTYLSPIPYDIILGSIFGFLFLCFLAYLEYKRRTKRAAMERYAMKRMRRKFKAMQSGLENKIVDWRTLYNEAKVKRDTNDPSAARRQAKQDKKNLEVKLKREKEIDRR
jgi:hypothetical protein